ncbi:hypothetical protein TD95_002831 [Thielaviopsis punctulata]|uniref:Bola-like protein n=1 Tax=Thielaviopsis punctulata TaxID=72032 RepID=A0A0F4ZFB6_9PEZI|nr:hypothetical protein TD95_002831 [Thielaviopsis punctulata]
MFSLRQSARLLTRPAITARPALRLRAIPPNRAISMTPARFNIPKPEELDAAESQIWDILSAEFEPTALFVRDVSGGCGSMYAIEVASSKFAGLTMLKQQRLVNAALGDLVKGWHGLQLRTRAA